MALLGHCSICKYFVQTWTDLDGTIYGECWRYPPQTLPTTANKPFDKANYRQIIITDQKTCGEFLQGA